MEDEWRHKVSIVNDHLKYRNVGLVFGFYQYEYEYESILRLTTKDFNIFGLVWFGLVWFLCLMACQLFLGYLMPKPFS